MNDLHAGYLQEHTDILSLRELSDGTIRCYASYLIRFLDWSESQLSCPDVKDISWPQVREYINYLKYICKLNPRTINGHISQLKDFFEYVLHRVWNRYEIPFMRYDRKLPAVPSFEQVNTIIDSIQNPKHKAQIALLYSSGIRVSELCRLKCGDIEASQGRIHISVSKNRCERYAILSQKALGILTAYIRSSYPHAAKDSWLFPGQKAGKHVTTEAVRQVFKHALSDLNWDDKGFTLHKSPSCIRPSSAPERRGSYDDQRGHGT